MASQLTAVRRVLMFMHGTLEIAWNNTDNCKLSEYHICELRINMSEIVILARSVLST